MGGPLHGPPISISDPLRMMLSRLTRALSSSAATGAMVSVGIVAALTPLLVLSAPVRAAAEECACPEAGTAPRADMSASCLAQCGLRTAAGGAGQGDAPQELTVIIGKVINVGLSLIGVVFLVLMLYGGVRWMTAQGEKDVVQKAKDIIKAAIIGVVIVALSFAVSNFIIAQLGAATD